MTSLDFVWKSVDHHNYNYFHLKNITKFNANSQQIFYKTKNKFYRKNKKKRGDFIEYLILLL